MARFWIGDALVFYDLCLCMFRCLLISLCIWFGGVVCFKKKSGERLPRKVWSSINEVWRAESFLVAELRRRVAIMCWRSCFAVLRQQVVFINALSLSFFFTSKTGIIKLFF